MIKYYAINKHVNKHQLFLIKYVEILSYFKLKNSNIKCINIIPD